MYRLRTTTRYLSARQFSYRVDGGGSDSSILPGLGLVTAVGSAFYIYHDPDVLPQTIRGWLPIREKASMTLEEYEAWRARQKDLPPVTLTSDSNVTENTVQDEENDNEQVSSSGEIIESLKKLYEDTKEMERTFLQQLKEMKSSEKRKHNTDEENQQIQMFKEEKARIQQQLKFVKKNLK